jgi:hypothetical protein
VTIDTEAAAATDDLVTINNGLAGRIMWLRAANGARDVVLKHGSGNIVTATATDYTLSSADQYAMLIHNGTNWVAALAPTAAAATSSGVDVLGVQVFS